MKSTIFLSVVIFLMSHFISSGQTLVNKEWDFNTGNPIVSKWAKSITTANNELITVGNTFVSGEGTNMFLSKYLSDGTIGWQINFNSLASANDYGIDLTLDNSGNIYVCGTTDNNTTSNHDVLLLKFNAQGGLLWNISFNSTFSLNDIPTAVKTDNFGNVFLSVNSESNTNFSDYLLLKYNSLGVLVWQQRYDFAGLTDFPIGLEFDSAGNVLLVGASASNLTNWDFTTVKYSPSGSFLGELRNTLGGSGFDEPLDYKKDLNNNFYIVGKGSTDGINYNIKLVKISSAFALEWVRDIEGYGKNDAGTTVDVDDAGNVIIAGYKTKSNNIKELFVSKFNAIGIEQWEHHQTSKMETADAEVQSIDVNNIGEVYALSKEVGKSQSDDILLSKFDINGNTVFEKVLNANANEEPKDIKITNDGNLYITALKSLPSSSGATLKTYETVKYSEYQQDPNVVFNADGVPLYKKNELIVRFDTSVVNRAAIDNQIGTAQKEFGDLNYFLKANAATTIQSILAPLCPNSDKDVQSSAGCPIKVVKIFKQLKTTLTTTTSRLGETIKVPDFWATLLLVLPDGMDVQAVQNSLRSLNEIIVYTELNVIPKFTSGANDNIYSQQHSLESTVYPDGDINMEAAWDIIPSGGRQDIKCGVFDTGIRWTHRDFGYDGVNPNSSKVVDGWDMAHDVPLKSGLGDNHGDGHGTKTAGIIGAIRNNNLDVAGIAGGNYQGNTNLSDKGIALYSLELEGWLPSPMNYVADAIITTSIDDSSLDYGYGLNVTNHSYGFDPNDFQFIDTNFTLIREATHFANRAKVTFVASRGNNGNDDEFLPATIDDNWILNVGGSGRDGEYCEPANCGVIISLSYGREMDIIAPASSDMVMTTHIGTPWVVSAGYTSSAAPHVTGVVGLLMSYLNDVGASYNNLAPEDCEQILQLSAEDMGTPQYHGYDDESGHGKLDAEAALRLVEKPYNKLLHFGTSDQISTIQKSINMISTGDSIKVTERFQKNDGTWLLADKYTANTYRIDCTVSHPLLATDSIRAFWPRHSSSSPFEHFDSDGTLFPRERIKIDACTATTCQMSGYIYNVFDENGNDIGWIPFPPSAISDAQFEYTILAKDRTVDVSKIEETQKLPICIYPNPSSDKVSIEIYARSIGSLKIRLCDIQGRIIEYIFDDKVNEGSNTVSHNIEKLPSGVYLYEIQLGNQITHEKIIKL